MSGHKWFKKCEVNCALQVTKDLNKKAVIWTECKCFLILNFKYFLYTSSMLWFGCFEASGNCLCTQKPLHCSFPKLTWEPKINILFSPLL